MLDSLPLHVLYVEDDPTLRTLFAEFLAAAPSLDIAATAATADEAITIVRNETIDVALLDLALGPNSINGLELGLRLRGINPHIGIVIISQHLVPKLVTSLPEQERHAWSYIQKRGDLKIDEVERVIRATAEGKVIIDPSAYGERALDRSVLTQLSPRQRDVLALLATGRDAIGIAEDLNVAHATVRRDLSNAYRVLVPNHGPGYDARTSALLEYLRATRPYDFDDSLDD
ncbi:MAG: response regulator [Thermoleophilia bacterium]